MNYVITDMYEAAYLKVNGFKIGKVDKGPEGKCNIDIKGNTELIKNRIDEFNNGGAAEVKAFVKELGFIRYLINGVK